MIRKLAIYLFIMMSCWSCVDVEDVIAPFIVTGATEGIVEVDTFYYQDSLKFTVTFRDNISVDSSVVSLTPLGGDIADSATNWVLFVTEVDSLRGSRFVTRNIAEEVPALLPKDPTQYTPTGKYVVSLYAIDKAERDIAFSDTFLLLDDITPPEFVDLSIDLDIVDGNLFTCPGFAVPISGGVKDNTQLRRIGYSFNDEAPFSLDVNTGNMVFDSISVGDAFTGSRSIVVPDSLNNQIVTVTVFAEDFFNNITEQQFMISVDCDTRGPDIEVVTTSPSINDDNVAFVVVGEQFSLDSIRITDESAVDSVEIFFALQGSTTPLDVKRYAIDPPVPEVIFDVNDNLLYPDAINGFDVAGLTYVITIRAYDTVTLFSNTGNVSGNVDLELIIKQDDPVNISAMDIILNEGDATAKTFSNVDTLTTYSISVAADLNSEAGFINRVIPDGKAEDDVGILAISMKWTDPSGTVIFNDRSDLNPAEPVIKLRDFHQDQLVFDADVKGVYVLEIGLTDSKRTQTFTYKFDLVD